MKKIAIIPVKKYSQRIANKNFLMIDGKPMFMYSVEAAMASGLFDKVIISTDATERVYEHLSEVYTLEVPSYVDVMHRDEELCKSDTKVADVCVDVLKHPCYENNFDLFCLLLPTNPLRTEVDLSKGLTFMSAIPTPDFVMSVSKYPFNANYALRAKEGTLKPAFFDEELFTFRRHEIFETYYTDGAVCWGRVDAFLKCGEISATNPNTVFLQIPPERALDVDEPLDLIVAKALMKERG